RVPVVCGHGIGLMVWLHITTVSSRGGAVTDFPLVDRERERDALRRLAAAGERRLGVLYGRRQVGKTFLLSRAWERPPFYFLAADSSPDLNRRDLVLELAGWSGRPLDPADYPTWRT